MSALNQHETTILRNARALLTILRRDGYDPETGKTGKGVAAEQQIKDMESALNMVTQMKGYYPK